MDHVHTSQVLPIAPYVRVDIVRDCSLHVVIWSVRTFMGRDIPLSIQPQGELGRSSSARPHSFCQRSQQSDISIFMAAAWFPDPFACNIFSFPFTLTEALFLKMR